MNRLPTFLLVLIVAGCAVEPEAVTDRPHLLFVDLAPHMGPDADVDAGTSGVQVDVTVKVLAQQHTQWSSVAIRVLGGEEQVAEFDGSHARARITLPAVDAEEVTMELAARATDSEGFEVAASASVVVEGASAPAVNG